MKGLTLGIFAAGIGSRYGGLKQIDQYGLSGETIMDFSIYDALQAGFTKVVFVIQRKHKALFEEELGKRIRPFMEVEYAFQDLDDVPSWFRSRVNRTRPWGTTHALLAMRNHVDTPFIAINADDYCGRESFVRIADFLRNEVTDHKFGMVGFRIENTLTEHGTVARGVCHIEHDYLEFISEVKSIARTSKGIVGGPEERIIPEGTYVSLNFWGFTPAIFPLLSARFESFLKESSLDEVLHSEAMLPNDIGYLIENHMIQVKVLDTPEHWFGVTYKVDKKEVKKKFAKLQESGDYPRSLWPNKLKR